MSSPRFVLVAGVARGGLSRPAWPDVSTSLTGRLAGDGSWVSWRLTGANHRELGRAMSVFPDALEALTAVDEVRVGVLSLQESVVASPRDGRWSWRLLLADELVASSGRSYSRHRECTYNLEAFLAAVPIAQVVDVFAQRRYGG